MTNFDAVRVRLKPGPILLGLEITGTDGDYFLGVSSADEPRKWFYRRDLDDKSPRVPLPVHSNEVIVWTYPGKVKQHFQSALKPMQVPFPKPTRKRRPYNLDEMQVIPETMNMAGPARVFKHRPIMNINPYLMNSYPEPTYSFIVAHELGHHYFDAEEDADAYAVVTLLNKGYGLSQIERALTHTLGKSKENFDRIMSTHRFLQDVNKYYG